MAGRIPREFIQDLLARVDVVDVIDARVPLKRSGNNFTARCPFHSEKTPSFSVSRDKQFYYCFGCGAHGNAIDFLMAYDRLGFVEAVENLSESVGLRVPTNPARLEDDPDFRFLKRLLEVQEQIARFYHSALKTHSAAVRAVDYLKSRGISGELARRYQLGYAPPGCHNLPPDLPQDFLEASGLLVLKDGKRYDRFRDRIMFPIRDRRGRVVGFGGRVLDDKTPKYLNSPETASFKKHKEVYGLYELLRTVRTPQRILVVEGYMDVVALAQYGLPNTVATLGTATSSYQVDLLFRFTGEIVFCFDGDAAGQNAAWKALEASLPALREGKNVRFLRLPEKHDPDSLIRAKGTEDFLMRIESAQPFSSYFFEHLRVRLGLPALVTLEQRTTLRDHAKPLIGKIPKGTFREMVERRLNELTDFDPVERLNKSAKRPQGRGSLTRNPKPSLLRTILILLLQNPDLMNRVTPEIRKCLIKQKKVGSLVAKLFTSLEAQPNLTTGGILELFRETPEEHWVKRLIAWPTDIVPDRIPIVFTDALSRLEKQIRKERLDELLQKPMAELSAEERKEMRMLMLH